MTGGAPVTIVGGVSTQTIWPDALVTGGTSLDMARLKSNNITNQASTVGSSLGDERGIAAGTYYFRIENLSSTDAITGVLNSRWEERP